MLTAVKATLSTGKVVVLREMKISDSEVAVQAVSKRANGDSNVLQFLMQKELVKLLLLSVNEKRLTAIEREDMDGLFTVAEYSQVLQVAQKLAGGDEAGNSPALEVVSFGDKSPGSVDTPA